MRKYIILSLTFLLFALASCSDDDNNTTEPTASELDGNWRSAASRSGGDSPYDYIVSLDLTFSDNQVSGSGNIDYTFTQNGVTSTSVTIQDDLTGTFNDPELNIEIKDDDTGYLYSYTGQWSDDDEAFTGTLKLTIDTHVFSDEEVPLFKTDD